MKKTHTHDTLSENRCSKCKTRLKKRLEHNDLCYECFKKKEASRGHYIDSKARQKRVQAGLPVKSF